jgi:hypothetical protein
MRLPLIAVVTLSLTYCAAAYFTPTTTLPTSITQTASYVS